MTRTVTWGDGLAVELFKTPGGLKAVVEAITEVLGPHYGTRNTFAKLTSVTDPEAMNAKEAWRAWLLLSTMGHDPQEWQLPWDMTPPYMDVMSLRAELQDALRAKRTGGLWAPRGSNPQPTDYGIAA